ncbi:MAG: amidohydrolase family protein [Bacillota bacterium]|nr:amidohydrolase family protein [Bacillota bacterium]
MIIDSHCHFMTEEYAKSSPFYSHEWYDFEMREVKKFQVSDDHKEILTYPLEAIMNKFTIDTIPEKIISFNDEVAKISSRYNVYATAAIYPLVESKYYLMEMERAINELGLCGFSLASSYDGLYLDDEKFWPLFEKASELNKPIFIHPVTSNPIGSDRLKDYRLMPMLGFVFDTTVCLTRLVLSGVLNRFNNVKLVFSHTGGAFAYLLPRIITLGNAFKLDIDSNNIHKTLKNVYFDTCTDDLGVLEFAIKTFGADKILFGSDFPAVDNIQRMVDAIDRINISNEEKKMILGSSVQGIL